LLGRLKTALAARDWTLLGMTTDGSPLSPTPLAEVLSGVPHQLCQLHVVKDIVKAVLQAVSSAQAPGGSATHIAPGPSEHQGGQAGRPHHKAAGSAPRRVVQRAISLRPTSPAHN
jgi:hypothetical protein